jgi:hypothetical protein
MSILNLGLKKFLSYGLGYGLQKYLLIASGKEVR